MKPKLLIEYNHSDIVNDLIFSPDNLFISTASNEVRVYKIPHMKFSVLEGHERAAVCVKYLSNEILVSSDYSSIHFWNGNDEKPLSSIKAHSSWVYQIAISLKRELLASVGNDTTLKVWDYSGCEIYKKKYSSFTESVGFSTDSKFLAVSTGSVIRILNTEDYYEQYILKGHKRNIRTITFFPNGRYLASGCYGGNIKIWDLKYGNEYDSFKVHNSCIWRVVFSPDSKYLASGDTEGLIKLRSIAQCSNECELEISGKMVLGIAFSPDGKFLAAGGDGKIVRLWNLES